MKYTAEFRRHPPPKSPARSTFSSTTIACRSSGARGLTASPASGRRGEVSRRIVEQIVDSAPVLPLLHAPVPQTVDSVGEVLKILDKLVRRAQDLSGPGLWALFVAGSAAGGAARGCSSALLLDVCHRDS